VHKEEYGGTIMYISSMTMENAETIPGMGEGIKTNDRGDEFNYDILKELL
jgi:hypothetical protein